MRSGSPESSGHLGAHRGAPKLPRTRAQGLEFRFEETPQTQGLQGGWAEEGPLRCLVRGERRPQSRDVKSGSHLDIRFTKERENRDINGPPVLGRGAGNEVMQPALVIGHALSEELLLAAGSALCLIRHRGEVAAE